MTVIDALNKWERRSFRYGDADCCQFAGFIARELTGTNYLKSFQYASEEAAYQIIEGHGSLKEAVISVLGDPTDDLDELPDGSPVLLEVPRHGEVMGVKLGDQAVCLVQNGMAQLPNKLIKSGWSLCRQ